MLSDFAYHTFSPDSSHSSVISMFASLTFVQPEGSIARDRYKNLEKRNMIEPKGPRLRSRFVLWTGFSVGMQALSSFLEMLQSGILPRHLPVYILC